MKEHGKHEGRKEVPHRQGPKAYGNTEEDEDAEKETGPTQPSRSCHGGLLYIRAKENGGPNNLLTPALSCPIFGLNGNVFPFTSLSICKNLHPWYLLSMHLKSLKIDLLMCLAPC